MHYLIHANDVPGREREFTEIVRRYEAIAPDNPHALHMPTHIFTRLGDWPAVIRGNLRAADAALKFPAGEKGDLVWDEFPHAIEYLTYAYLQQGADEQARAQVERLQHTKALQPTFKTAFHLASTQARLALERRQWKEAHALVPREPSTLDWDRFPWAEGVTWFARGLGAAHEGALADARDAINHLQQLEERADKAGEVIFTRNIRALRLATSAWLAQGEGRKEDAARQMREAAEVEASTPKHAVTPGPTLSSYELLGDLLMAQGNASGALDAYDRSMTLYPRRFNSVVGAARAARASGNERRSRELYSRLLEIAKNGTREPDLSEARRATRRHTDHAATR
jgi:tetratricopeptide (TPR) repeat protein